MAVDTAKAARRGQTALKTKTKHPYAAIQWRVLDNAAYADMTFSAQALLMQLARQLTADNNGHLQATFSYMQQRGFGSEHTLSLAIKDLITHGMIFRTRKGGYEKGASLYAVTWLSITKKEGLDIEGFKTEAWRNWVPTEKKSPLRKMQETHGKKCMLPPVTDAVYAGGTPPKSADNVLVPCTGSFAAVNQPIGRKSGIPRIGAYRTDSRNLPTWIH